MGISISNKGDTTSSKKLQRQFTGVTTTVEYHLNIPVYMKLYIRLHCCIEESSWRLKLGQVDHLSPCSAPCRQMICRSLSRRTKILLWRHEFGDWNGQQKRLQQSCEKNYPLQDSEWSTHGLLFFVSNIGFLTYNVYPFETFSSIGIFSRFHACFPRWFVICFLNFHHWKLGEDEQFGWMFLRPPTTNLHRFALSLGS